MLRLMIRSLAWPLTFLLSVWLCFGSWAAAQTDQGRITGLVRDINGAVVAGATITVRNERTGEERTVTANQDGFYAVTPLKPSTYSIVASAPNFAPAQVSGVALAVGQELNLTLTLQPVGVAASVNVVSADEAAIDTSSARIGANVNQREVQSLPINGRQLSQLYLQAPGSVNSGSGTYGDIRFSGRAVEQNIIRLDGVEGTAIIDASPGNLNGEIPSPFRLQTSLENVQEFRVESNSYPAEYGTGTGGQITVISKSGSNEFHGSAFEYLRNDALDARNFFDLNKKSPLRLNQFGGSIGGPIIKNRFFFFLSYEGYRLRSGINSIEAVPSAAVRARAVPAVVPLLDAFRGPGAVILPGASANPDFEIAQLQSVARVDENAVGARFDYKFNDRYSLFFRYYRDQGTNDQPEGVTGRRAFVRAVPQNAVLSFQQVLTPQTINETKIGFNEALTRVNGIAPTVNGIDLSRITINITGSVANVGIAGQGASSGVAVPGGLLRQNSATNGRGAPYTPYSISFIDNLNHTRGNHAIKIGGEVRLVRMYTDRLGGTTYTYQNLNAFLANTAQSVQFLGDLSAPSVFNNGATGERFAKQEYYIAYAQDEWRIRPNLTLNYGLRYEYYTPLREARNLAVVFDINNGTLLPPDRPYFKSSKTNFGPRLAVAWTPKANGNGFFGGGRTVLRAGFGIYYGPGQTEDQIQPIESDRVSSTLSNVANAFPQDPAVLTANFINNPLNRQFQPRAYAPEYEIPERVYQYSVSFQQELPRKLVLTVAYVGSQGRNLFLRNFTNRILPGSATVLTGANYPTGVGIINEVDATGNLVRAVVVRQFDIVQGNRVLRPYAEIDYKTSGGSDSYNALQLALSRRLTSGLTLNSQYTLGRSYGNSSGSNEALTAGNPFDYNYDRGYNAFDIRHSFNLSAVYALPFGRGQAFLRNVGGVGQALVGNWELAAIFNARSGLPLDIRVVRPDIVYVDANGNVFNNPAPDRRAVINTPGGGASRNVRRPDLIPGVNPYLDNDRQFLNPAAFAIPAPGKFGNLKRGLLRGPNFKQFDLMIAKRLPITERSNIELRAEFFNLFNTTNFANPPVTLPNALPNSSLAEANRVQPGQPFTQAAAGVFGILNRTVERTVGLGTNRQIQLAVRFNF